MKFEYKLLANISEAISSIKFFIKIEPTILDLGTTKYFVCLLSDADKCTTFAELFQFA